MKLMIVGLGDLGGVILDLAARQAEIGRIAVAGRDEARCLERANLARLGAAAGGSFPEVVPLRVDLDDASSLAEAVFSEAPDVILLTASRASWRLGEQLTLNRAAQIREAGFGIWLPLHLALPIRFMRALDDCGFKGISLVAPYPDVVNPVLSELGLAPTAGIGNLDEIVPKLQLLTAAKLEVSPGDVEIRLVGHHSLQRFVFSGEVPEGEMPPFHVHAEVDGRDVSDSVDFEALLRVPYPIPHDRNWHSLTASSAIRILKALSGPVDSVVHAPGPFGSPGGYPVLASARGLKPFDIPGVSAREAVAINERSHRFDGVERIEAGGKVVFTVEAAISLKRSLGYECFELSPADVESRADELAQRFNHFKSHS